MKRIFFLLLTIFILTSSAAAQGKKILYVPIDNRPCNFYQVLQVAKKLDYEILTPPEEIIGSKNFYGDPDKIWAWLEENAASADYAVLSTDALLYGSLVGSRNQDLHPAEILELAQRFKAFDKKFPHVTIFAFGTIMRTPRTASYTTEPAYYTTHGLKIFEYTALLDKKETEKLSGSEQRQLKKLEAEIPVEYLQDWMERRKENFDANKYLIDLTRAGVFEYFLLGCDDSAIFSQTHRESRYLRDYAKDLGKTVVQVTSGADELGMLMIARAINEDKNYRPFISVEYNAGKGAQTFPKYCNETIGTSIDAAILAAGGLRIPSHDRADLVVAVNTRKDGKTFEAGDPKKNSLKYRDDLKTFMEPLKNFVAKKYPVAVADVAFSNGADNALMNQLKKNDLQFKIRSYGGWNTATNASGFLIGAGTLTRYMDDKAVAELLITRYLDDWAYEANVRQEIFAASYSTAGAGDPFNLNEKLLPLEKMLNEKMTAFVAENLKVRWRLEDLKFSLPWQRTFECDPRFKLSE